MEKVRENGERRGGGGVSLIFKIDWKREEGGEERKNIQLAIHGLARGDKKVEKLSTNMGNGKGRNFYQLYYCTVQYSYIGYVL